MSTQNSVCYLCDSPEIVNEHCLKCQKPYCAQDASRINPALYCDDCQRDVVIEETTFTKIVDEDDNLTEVHQHKTECKIIKFRGIDWMFACQKICELPEEELKPILEYHKAMVKQMEAAIVAGRIKTAHAQVQMQHPAGRRIINLTQTRTSKTIKTVKQARVAEKFDMNTLVMLAIKMGITSGAQLEEFLKAKIAQKSVQ